MGRGGGHARGGRRVVAAERPPTRWPRAARAASAHLQPTRHQHHVGGPHHGRPRARAADRRDPHHRRGHRSLRPARRRLPAAVPSDFYTVADETSSTGRRLALPAESLPANAGGKHIDPTHWNDLDGFSPAAAILFRPRLDLAATGRPGHRPPPHRWPERPVCSGTPPPARPLLDRARRRRRADAVPPLSARRWSCPRATGSWWPCAAGRGPSAPRVPRLPRPERTDAPTWRPPAGHGAGVRRPGRGPGGPPRPRAGLGLHRRQPGDAVRAPPAPARRRLRPAGRRRPDVHDHRRRGVHPHRDRPRDHRHLRDPALPVRHRGPGLRVRPRTRRAAHPHRHADRTVPLHHPHVGHRCRPRSRRPLRARAAGDRRPDRRGVGRCRPRATASSAGPT